ncbi:MAG: synthase subunit delta [Myxococcaceae bacterium]|nr:synthase subunit delta [Myxococcaceae bacterium]
MVNVSIARRYARALLEASGAAADQVLAELQGFVLTLESSSELKDVISNPAYSRAQRQAILEGLLAARPLNVALANTLRLLNDRNRLSHVGDIARVYRDLVDVRMGRVRGKVTSATALDAGQLKALEDSLQKLTQRDVLLETTVDKQLLGGLTAQVGSVVYDGSLRNQLQQLARELK